MTHNSGGSVLHPYDLQAEQRHEPLGLDAPRPRLSWKLACDRRGAAQSAYRITAAARRADLDGASRLQWDSGRRESGDGLLVPWDGPVLHSATRYHWRVEVWDETGGPAAAAQSWFEAGLLHRGDWTAVWVGRDPAGEPPVDPPRDDDPAPPGGAPLFLRREFELASRPVRVRLYATARGVYEPRLNGTRVGDAELAPGWTEYHHGCTTRPTTSPTCCARAAMCSARSSPTAGGRGMSDSTPAAPRCITATHRPSWPS